MKLRKGPFVWTCLVGLALAATASFAWGCTPTPVMSIRPGTGPAGTDVIVTGANFEPGPVEIRWNSVSGPLAMTGNSMNFSLRSPADLIALQGQSVTPNMFKVPGDMNPGIYYLIAIQKDSSGSITGKAATTFQVTSGSSGASAIGSSSSTSSELWTAFDADAEAQAVLTDQTAGSGGDLLGLKLGLTLVAVGIAASSAVFTMAAASRRKARR